MISEPALPAVLAEVAEVAGLGAALALWAARAGCRIYIPQPNQLTGHWLTGAVGTMAAEAIATRFGGDTLDIPMGPHSARARIWAAIRRGLAEGLDANTVARLAGVHHRTVRRHRNGRAGTEDEGQGELFDEV